MEQPSSRWIVVVFAAVLSLAACSKSGGGSGGSSNPIGTTPSAQQTVGSSPTAPASAGGRADDPCSLLSQSQVEAAVGNPVQAGTADVGPSCHWEHGAASGTSVGLAMDPMTPTECANAKRTGDVDVEGLGVQAWWHFVEPAATGSVVACPSGYMAQVTLVGAIGQPADEAQLRAAAESLMKTALGKL